MDNIKIQYSAEQSLTIPMIKSGEKIQNVGKKYKELKSWIEKKNLSLFSSFTHDLPEKFHTIRPTTHFIYAIGDINLLSRPMLGIVGPRKNSPYAEQIVASLLETAKSYDVVTISGMARGVDTLCHKYSIQNGIPTIAVL